MTSYEFRGFVCKVNRQQWGVEVFVRADKDENAQDVKYPQHILFSASKKNEGKVPVDLAEDDEVTIKFIPILNEGISDRTKRAYAINKMMIASITVEAKAESSGGESEPLPF